MPVAEEDGFNVFLCHELAQLAKDFDQGLTWAGFPVHGRRPVGLGMTAPARSGRITRSGRRGALRCRGPAGAGDPSSPCP